MNKLFEFDNALRTDYPLVCGADEAGRGPLCGPVCCAAVILPADFQCEDINDSKKISEKKREMLYEEITEKAISWSVAFASVEEIDALNILEANFLAMRRALSAIGILNLEHTLPELPIESSGFLKTTDEFLIAVDGNLLIRKVQEEYQIPVVKGDAKIASISAASILAKVYRDRLMDKLGETFPMYDFSNNAGYGTKKHLEALQKYGLSPVHRKTFRPKSLNLE